MGQNKTTGISHNKNSSTYRSKRVHSTSSKNQTSLKQRSIFEMMRKNTPSNANNETETLCNTNNEIECSKTADDQSAVSVAESSISV